MAAAADLLVSTSSAGVVADSAWTVSSVLSGRVAADLADFSHPWTKTVA